VIVPRCSGLPMTPMATGRAPGATLCEWMDAGVPQQLWAPDAPSVAFLTPVGVSAEAQVLWLASPDRLVALGANTLFAMGNEVFVTGSSDTAGSDVVAGRSAIGWTTLSGTNPTYSIELP
jgi:hypothetical protein